MSSYLVLARKYRPSNFDELVGQSILVRALTNSIKLGKLHHAYMLTGIRGIGKTTTARIIAKTINCLDENTAISAKACDNCDNCRAISLSKHQDVIEIDAASRTGVDDMREIIDSISYSPVMAKYKIYIIDEVHMLSNNAFNALLKTLEEPPSFVKFIFATTEIKKVPSTILSRCQRFDLKRLSDDEMTLHLTNILSKENYEAHPAALSTIARMSEGSVRDALSLLDQALAINGHEHFLPEEVVGNMLGLTNTDLVINLLARVISSDLTECFKIFHEFYQSSSDIVQLNIDMAQWLHKIIIEKKLPDFPVNHLSSSQHQKIKDLAASCGFHQLLQMWELLKRGLEDIKKTELKKICFEIMLVKLCHIISMPNLKQILINLKEDGKRIDEKQEVDNPGLVQKTLQTFGGSKLL